ncbi:NYN domain-containing protein [uncultured Treponema sp.]|uniref:NYN domain-containing protein n=1 Tax=uncultured Treponema sp. TaxID=162155 RepID=UPI002600F230|nr:NYN domain-containing protein [uncultured Treponema sp.]
MEEIENKNIAVLIDADNTPCKKLRAILQEIAVHGHIITKRAYGDFSLNTLKNWKNELNDNAIIPVQQFAYTQGKNSSDSAMIIDAMDLLYTDKYDAIALVTSDSDFTKLATRLRESQIYVFGVGQKKTPQSFISACDDFIYIENLKDEEEETPEEDAAFAEQKRKSHKSADKPKKSILGILRKNANGEVAMSDRQFRKIFKLLNTAYDKYADETGWADVSAAGSFFKRQDPGFDTVDYGFRKLTDLIEYFDDDFEMKREAGNSRRHVTFYYRPVEKN